MKLKNLICAALLGGSLIFGGTVEAGIVTDRFPLTCYADHRINTFNGINGQQVGYIDANVDWITITEYRDGWVKATYNGLRNPQYNPRWFRVTEVCADPNYSNRSVNVQGNQTVYTTRSSNTKMGSVSNNESVIVMAEIGNRAQILYRLDNGTGYKMGWVPSSAIPSRNTQPVMPNNPLIQPVSRYATINDGWYKISPLHTPNRLLDVYGASTAVGANIQLWDNASNVSQPNQVFYLKNLGNNWFTLKAGHCNLNVAAANTSGSLRTNIQLASPNSNSAAQRWRLVVSGTNGAYYIESAIRDKLAFDCEGAGSGNGTNIWLWEHGNVDWNKWRFIPVSAPVIQTVEKTIYDRMNYLSKNEFNYRVNTTFKGKPRASEQCKGFARNLFEELFGVNVGSTNPNDFELNAGVGYHEKSNGRVRNVVVNDGNAFKSIFMNAKPGSFVQMKRRRPDRKGNRNPHSAILLSVDNDGVQFFEANADGNMTIQINRYIWSGDYNLGLADRNTDMTIYEPNSYQLR